HTGTISYTDTDDLTVGTVSDTACSTPTSSTGIISGGADVKLTTTHTNSPLSIAAAVNLGTTGNPTLDINGDVSQTTNVGNVTAKGLQIRGTGTVRLDTATNDVDTIAATHTGSITYKDTDKLTIATVADTAAALGVSSSGITTNSGDVAITSGGVL